ncbi:MAG TPA: hypothetical protein VH092_37955 [Urbifossiella sp.]|jgi:hypothetical protein|nr:hypothetical protein [Urbifossiella sp.]
MRSLVPAAVLAAALALTPAAAQPPAPSSQPLTRFDSRTDWGRVTDLFKPHNPREGRTAVVRPDSVWFDFAPVKGVRDTGVKAFVTLRGDFQVEVRYDLQEFPVSSASDSGVLVALQVDGDPDIGTAAVERGVYFRRGHDGQLHRLIRGVPTDAKRVYAITAAPAGAKAGRLALRRVGSEVIGLAADAPDAELAEFMRYPFTDGPIRAVSLTADAGGTEATLKARLYDLQVRTGADIPAAPGAARPQAFTINPMPARLAAAAALTYRFVPDAERLVGFTRDGTLQVGKLDARGEFHRVSEHKTGELGVVVYRGPAFDPLAGAGGKGAAVYEYRSGVLIPGRIDGSGHFVPDEGGRIIRFPDYQYSPAAVPVWNLPGRFERVPPAERKGGPVGAR